MQFGRKREGELIDGQSEDDTGMGASVDDEFALGIVQVALKRHHRASEGDALMPAVAALHMAVAEWHVQGFPIVGSLSGVELVSQGVSEGLNQFVER